MPYFFTYLMSRFALIIGNVLLEDFDLLIHYFVGN